MVSRSQLQTLILGSSLMMAIACNYIYESWEKNKPDPEIPIQSWNKYVAEQKKLGREI